VKICGLPQGLTIPPEEEPDELPPELEEELDPPEEEPEELPPEDDPELEDDELPPELEEETIEAIQNQDYSGLKEELGDLLLHVIFQTRLAEIEGNFTFEDVCESIIKKMIRRHPHVFSQKFIDKNPDITIDDIKHVYKIIKGIEKAAKNQSIDT
jgi:NTP pyrophosphatase (non-canonical NTP hydrolase)